jgi:hypothetical protein
MEFYHTASIVIGRFQPPTRAHQHVIDRAKGLEPSVIHHNIRNHVYIFTTPSQDQKLNPLATLEKVRFLETMYPKYPTQKVRICTDAFNALEIMSDIGFRNVNIVAGADRLEKYRDFLRYVGTSALENIQAINLVSAGDRDPDSEPTGTEVNGISGSLAREYVAEGNYNAFQFIAPTMLHDKDKKRLYNSIRRGMGLSWDKT